MLAAIQKTIFRGEKKKMRQGFVKHLLLRAGVIALALQCGGAAYASVVLWDNGGPAVVNEGGSNMSDTFQAEDFELAVLSNLTGVRFWNLQGTANDYAGSIFYQIVTNAGGSPSNTVVGSGLVTPTRVAAGSMLGLSQFQNDFSISLSNVAAGTYWLELHNGPLSATTFSDFYWTWTDLNGVNTLTNRGRERALDPPSAAWTTNDQEHAFLIAGDAVTETPVPEPATLLLTASGIAAVVRRRQRKHQA
jgi:hypothetical protein